MIWIAIAVFVTISDLKLGEWEMKLQRQKGNRRKQKQPNK